MQEKEFMELMLRKSFFYPSAEVYGKGFAGFWGFGPVGVRIKRKIAAAWRKELVEKEGFLEISGSVILPQQVFDASGHSANFNDPLTQCTKCSAVHRADSLLQDHLNVNFPEGMPTEKFDAMIEENSLKCPKCKGSLGKVKRFNMMMTMKIGATGKQLGGLRPETAQNIFLDFERMYKSQRVNLPMGIAQVGKAFRNEIAPRNTILRSREFDQMEIEVFFNPDKINEVPNFNEVQGVKVNILDKNEKVHSLTVKELFEKKIVSGKLPAYCLARVQEFWESLGFPKEKTRFREVGDEERAFYAKETWDFEVQTPYGWIELVANNHRNDYDLGVHAKGSKKNLKVKEDGKEFLPHVFEISAGLDRTFFTALLLATREETKKEEKRVFLDIPISIAPYITGIFPLVKKDGLLEKARELSDSLKGFGFEVLFDEKGSIGRRYARIDELGVPFALTLDYDSMEDGTVTLRERNSTAQKRVKISELPMILWALSLGQTTFEAVKGKSI